MSRVKPWMQLDSPGIYKVVLGNVTFNIEESKLVKKDNTLFVPVRYASEALGAKVEWKPDTRTVAISFK